MLPDWIVKYWVQWLFGLIIAFLTGLCKKFYSMYQKEKVTKEEETKEQLQTQIKEAMNEFKEEMAAKDKEMQEEIRVIKKGILNMQGKQFKQNCHELINRDHEISLQEFESLQEDHNVYNSLGGNHEGDELYKIAYEKATKQLSAN